MLCQWHVGRSHHDAGWTDADEGGRVLIGREWRRRPRAKSGFYQFRNLEPPTSVRSDILAVKRVLKSTQIRPRPVCQKRIHTAK